MDPYNEIRPTLVLVNHSCRKGEETLPILQLDSRKSVIYCRYDIEGPTSERELQYAPKNSYLKWNKTTIFYKTTNNLRWKKVIKSVRKVRTIEGPHKNVCL